VSTVVADIPSQERGPKNDRVWFWLLSRCGGEKICRPYRKIIRDMEARENVDRIVDLSSSTL
jgi:hypothetical protein